MNVRRAVVVATMVALAVSVAAPARAAADTTPPTTPTNFRVISSTTTTVTLGWNPSSDNSGNWYYYLTDNFFQQAYPQKTRTSWTMPTPSPNTTYVYNLRAFDFSGNGSGTVTVSHTTPPDTTPPTAPVLSLSYVASARMAVTWTKGVDAVSWFVTHTLLVDGAPRTGDLAGGTGQTLLNLTPSTTYSLVVTARDQSGNTSTSNTLVVTTPAQTDFTAPTAPTNLSGRADIGSCEVYVSWTPSTDNVDPDNRLLNRFRVNGVLAPVSSWVMGGNTNIGRTVLEGPVPGPTTFTVEAVDSAGNVSAVSNGLVLNVDHC